jgi:hypothetical protein
MDDAKLICARLLRETALERDEVRALDFPEVRADVERRLGDVGLMLATSAYSRHVGLRLSPDVTGDKAFDSASNLRLQADHCALLVVLWSRLVLQKRTATDSRDVPGQIALLPEDRSKAAREFEPQLRFETLVREFGPVIGSREHLHRLVTTLRRLRFLGGRGETIEAGPLLELGIDGEKMIAFIRRRVLSDLLRQQPASEVESEPPTAEDQVWKVMESLGGEASMKQLEVETGERAERLRQVLRELKERGIVARTGSGAKTRYRIVKT